MPRRSNLLCRARQCGATHTNNNGYCDEHQQQASNWSRRKDRKGSTTARGYGHSWTKMRKETLMEDNYLCRICKQLGRLTEASHVDHIKPKSQGGTDAPTNRQSLCTACHEHKTATEQRGGGSQIPTA